MQSTREIASEYRLRHWAQIIANQKGSGLNIKDYCEREGFNQNRYFYWQRTLRQTLCDALPAAVGGQIAPEGGMDCSRGVGNNERRGAYRNRTIPGDS